LYPYIIEPLLYSLVIFGVVNYYHYCHAILLITIRELRNLFFHRVMFSPFLAKIY